jgi:hypothetical protein
VSESSAAVSRDIQSTVHSLETRVSVLESRAQTHSESISAIRQDIMDIKKANTSILYYVIATLLSVLISIGLLVFGKVI